MDGHAKEEPEMTSSFGAFKWELLENHFAAQKPEDITSTPLIDPTQDSPESSDDDYELVDKDILSDDPPDREQFDFVADRQKSFHYSGVPVLFLINPRSGGGLGQICIDKLNKMDNVLTMSLLDFAGEESDEAHERLQILLTAMVNMRVVAGGGDGTVGWVFGILEKIGKNPPVAVLPLGTGNEFSGCVGWSHTISPRKLEDFTSAVRMGKLITVDVWKVEYIDDEGPSADSNEVSSPTSSYSRNNSTPKAHNRHSSSETPVKSDNPEFEEKSSRHVRSTSSTSSGSLNIPKDSDDSSKQNGTLTRKIISFTNDGVSIKDEGDKATPPLNREDSLPVFPDDKDDTSSSSSSQPSPTADPVAGDSDQQKAYYGRRPDCMVAFMSWGHDADISHKFHEEREKRKSQSSRFFLKMSYIRLGVKEMVKPGPRLNRRVTFTMDGNPINLAKTRSCRCFQVLNINRMAEQIDYFSPEQPSNEYDMLKDGDFQHPDCGDGLMELVGTKTIHHMNLMRLKVTHAIRLAQGHELHVKLDFPTPMLIDGEAWLNPAGIIRISHGGSKPFVLGPKENPSVKEGVRILRESEDS